MEKKKNDEIKPEDLWKKVSQQLSSKKQETQNKNTFNSIHDFSAFAGEIQKITNERALKTDKANYRRFLEVESENSFLNKPFIFQLEPKFNGGDKINTPSFFPKHPYVMFNNPNFYKKFDLDCLFFIFYYFKGQVQQTYAAIRLKQYAWRFHLKYKMWFQRLDEPKLITVEYEKGEFLFFDYETTWNFMRKNDFVFEYYYLEQNDFY